MNRSPHVLLITEKKVARKESRTRSPQRKSVRTDSATDALGPSPFRSEPILFPPVSPPIRLLQKESAEAKEKKKKRKENGRSTILADGNTQIRRSDRVKRQLTYVNQGKPEGCVCCCPSKPSAESLSFPLMQTTRYHLSS